MISLRRIPGLQLVALAAAAVLVLVGCVAIARAALGGSATPPPRASLQHAVQQALDAPPLPGITARIHFTQRLFEPGSLVGNAASALLDGAAGRLWLRADGKLRVELQTRAGDVQVGWDGQSLLLVEPAANLAYRYRAPAPAGAGWLTQARTALSTALPGAVGGAGRTLDLRGPTPGTTAGVGSYSVTLTPRHSDGLLGRAELAWDAVRGIPLRAAVYAAGQPDPVLELAITEISYGDIAAPDVAVAPPAGAHVVSVDPRLAASLSSGRHGPAARGLDAVRQAVAFPVAAPPTLVGLPRTGVDLIGIGSERMAVVRYGRGLGQIVLVERRASRGDAPLLAGLPRVAVAGTTGHELATPLGSALAFERRGVQVVVAGSVPAVAAEAAAREVAQ